MVYTVRELKIWHVLVYILVSRILSLVLPLHYELLDAFIPLNMPILNELCCCCWICCCCCCCWLFAWRPCFGTGGCRYSCLASVNTSIRSSFLYARQLLMKLCNSKLSCHEMVLNINFHQFPTGSYLCFVADGWFIRELNFGGF